MTNKTEKLAVSSLLAAVVCVFTFVITLRSPTGGYINPADGFVLLCGLLLGGKYGFFAAGIGSAIADAISGYVLYVPASFIIKGLVALIASCSVVFINKLEIKSGKKYLIYLLFAVLGEAVMIVSYFFYAAFFLGKGTAAFLSVSGNCFQAVFGIAVYFILIAVITKNSYLKNKFRLF